MWDYNIDKETTMCYQGDVGCVRRLIAKSAEDGSHQWLPLQVHLADAGEMASYIWKRWVSAGIKACIEKGCGGDAYRVFRFIALTHDLGKATPDFQQKILKGMRVRNTDAGQEAQELLDGVLDKPMISIMEHKPHALMSQWIAYKSGCNEAVASVLGAHHGRASEQASQLDPMEDGAYDENIEGYGTKQWARAQQYLLNWALEQAGYADISEIPIPSQPSLVLLTGLLIVADWMASNSKWFPYIPIRETEPHESSLQRAEYAWRIARLPKPWTSDADTYEDAEWLFDVARYGFDTPNQMQRTMMDIIYQMTSPGVIILESGMGTGKTEAALAAAELLAAKTKRSGVFFALPTQATSNGIFPRLKRWADAISHEADERHSIRLVHGAAHLNEEYYGGFEGHANVYEEKEKSGVSVHAWFEGGKKALLADFVVGTVDQLLMAALSRKHVMLRHIGLAGKVVIVDECHAYDAYMNMYLERALAWLSSYGVPTIILSATLPPARRNALLRAYTGATDTIKAEMLQTKSYPLMTWSDGGMIHQMALPTEQKPYTVQVEPLLYDGLLSAVDEIMDEGGCLGIVMNTVRGAQELTMRLNTAYPGKDIRLLHSGFIMADRVVKEQKLIQSLGKHAADDERPEWCIVVGTQVIEQSLDIDFDVMITELCPMDLILQRIGRLHRHPRRNRPQKHKTPICYVLGAKEPLSDANKAVYGPWLLMRTQEELPDSITLPTDIPTLVQNVYDESNCSTLTGKLKEAWDSFADARKLQRRRADTFLLKAPKRLGTTRIHTLNDWQSISNESPDEDAEAAVRDVRASLEVLALRHDKDGTWHFLGDNGLVPPELDYKAAARIAGQRLRLSSVLCSSHPNAHAPSKKLVEYLEAETAETVPDWQQFQLLKGELLLEFDENAEAKLNGYHLSYDPILGLYYKREGDNGKTI